jgi:hypothetical protein
VQRESRPARRLLALLFIAGVLILLDQSADLIATVLSRPADPSAASWRFGVFGMVASRASALLVGDVMLFAAATALGWRSVLKVLGALHLLLAVGVLAGLVLFLLDAVQVRGAVAADATRGYAAAVVRTGLVALATGITFAWAGLAAWGAGSRHRGGRAGAESLVVVARKEGPEA